MIEIHFGANVIAQGVLRPFFQLGNIIGFKPAAGDFLDEFLELAFVGTEKDALGLDAEGINGFLGVSQAFGIAGVECGVGFGGDLIAFLERLLEILGFVIDPFGQFRQFLIGLVDGTLKSGERFFRLLLKFFPC